MRHPIHLTKDMHRTMTRLLMIAVLALVPFMVFAQTGQAAPLEDSALVQQADPTPVTSHGPDDFVDDGFAPGLAVFALLALMTMLVLIGVGLALGAALLLMVAGLIAGGIISGSVLVGLYHRSFASGFLTFLVSAGAVGGAVAGATTLWLACRWWHWLPEQTGLILGGLGGLAAGIILGIGSYYALRGLARIVMGVRGS